MTSILPTGVLEALTGAAGHYLDDLAGYRFTRLTAAVAAGATTFPVETTLGWPSSGRFVADGVVYTYASKTPTSLVGVEWPDVGLAASGHVQAVSGTVVLATVNGSNVEVTITGAFSGQLAFEGTVDGTTWVALSMTPAGGGGPVTSCTAAGSWTALLTAQLYVRVRAAAWSVGDAAVTWVVYSGEGARQAHEQAIHVLDLSRTYSTLDATRGQFLVDTAEGEFLSVLGRNLGVRRPPNLTTDASFREVVKALAYNPKGTMHGIELALDAFFGRGNYQVWENLVPYPNTVFIKLLGGVALTDTSLGQAYLEASEPRPLTLPAATLTVTGPVLTVQGVRLADEDRADVLTATRPSAVTEIRYSGDAGAPAWTWGGTGVEATCSTMAAATGCTLTNAGAVTAYYYRTARIRPESRAAFTVAVRPTTMPSLTDGRQFMVQLRNGARDLAVGFRYNGANVSVGFVDSSTGAWLTSAAAAIMTSDYVDVGVRQNHNGTAVELLVDGRVVQTAAQADFIATALNEFRWGSQVAALSVTASVKVVAGSSITATDYWNDRGTAGTVSTAAPTTFDTHAGSIIAGDVGRAFRTISATVPANNGVWRVATRVSVDQVTLVGVTRPHAYVESGLPGRISFGLPEQLRYPDDLGKGITIQGGAAAGTYTITQLRDELGNVMTVPGPATSCTVSGAPGTWVTEAGLLWNLVPAFTTDTGLSWEIVAVGTTALPTLTLRSAPPLNVPGGYQVVVRPLYTQVETAQIIPTLSDVNEAVLGGRSWYPVYLPQHPWGPYAAYLEDLTVAGVIPELVY